MRVRAVAGFGAALVLFAACGGDDDGGEAAFDTANGFVGELEGTDAFVAVVADEDSVEVYACDGESGIAERFTGEVDDPEDFTVSNDNGGEAVVAFADGAYSGEVTLSDGSTHAFTTEAAEGDAGLYHPEALPEDIAGAGWVVLNDGTQRGSILFAGGGSLQVRAAPPTDDMPSLNQMDLVPRRARP
jgi:hypothetical protein